MAVQFVLLAGAPHAVGMTAGAVVEGTIVGTAEKVAPKVEEQVKKALK